MQLTVTHEEAQVLVDVLDTYLPELRKEVYKTENFALREQWKRRETVLKALITRLGALLGQPRPC
ncbi:MAG TPA: hypothetical protein VNJ12_09385 [Candidatus Dormibacteraeota bacterium]|nr:hypothetical protein [Candidatus Dormibacteraeota bacterium]